MLQLLHSLSNGPVACTVKETDKIEEILCTVKSQGNRRIKGRLTVKESVLFDACVHR